MESEFIALDKAGEEVEWLRNFLKDISYRPKPMAPVCIHCDSQAAIGRARSMMYNGKYCFFNAIEAIIISRMATISSSPMELNRLTEKVNKAADAAGEVVRKYYSKAARFQFREKDGDGPVTCADVEAEQAIVSVILDAFPSHSIYGEETGWHTKDNACFLWC
ncbi:putative DNA polymerase zeta catalytic subunit-like [Capsicum annuum]|nr:putative DNA polymerase zeta catalytic subunit-like [Capsicum annuum]